MTLKSWLRGLFKIIENVTIRMERLGTVSYSSSMVGLSVAIFCIVSEI